MARRAEGIRLGLEVVGPVYEALGRPGVGIDAVHVVGTNGKGSTAALIAHGLGARGHRVGLYTSPHLWRVGERVQVDGHAIDDDDLLGHVHAVLHAEAQVGLPRGLTFFELLTLAAMRAFAARAPDVLVVEAGLGGRLDATRVLEARVVAVTRIGLDHMAWLGDTVAAIAAEKAAVFRPGVPVVSCRQRPEVAAVIAEAAARNDANLEVVPPLSRPPIGLVGDHQRHNAAVALAAGRVLDPGLAPADLDGVAWPGRLETVPWRGGRLVLDAAHNADGVEAFVAHVRPQLRPEDAVAFGCAADRPAASLAAQLRTLGRPLWWVPPDGDDRPCPPDAGIDPDHRFSGPDDPALRAAITARCAVGGTVWCCGSHRVIGPLRAWVLGIASPRQPGERTASGFGGSPRSSVH